MIKMKKMRGLLDPYTLGFLLSLIGATTAYVAHSNDEDFSTESKKSTELIESADISTDEND